MSDGDRGKRAQDLVAAGLCTVALLAAVILAFAIGNASGVNGGREQVSAREHYEHTKQDNLRACIGREGAAAVECVSEAIEAAQQQSDSRQDLYAQRDMSRWAFWLLILTAITVAITAVGVWFVKRTLEATLEAVEDTGKATEAMQDANEIARAANKRAYLHGQMVLARDKKVIEERREGERRQLRAYVDFESVRLVLDHHRYAKPGHEWRGVRVTLKNFGQTPADDLELRAVFNFEPMAGEVVQLGDYTKTGLGAIMPSATCAWSDFLEFSEQRWVNIGNAQAQLLVTIVAKYVDAFGEARMLAATYGTDRWNEEMGFVPGTRTHS